MNNTSGEKLPHEDEIQLQARSGMGILLLNLLAMLVSITLCITGGIMLEANLKAMWVHQRNGLLITMIIVGGIYFCIVGPILFAGLKVLKPNEALVITLFGKYRGTLRGAGYFFVNPFSTSFNPAAGFTTATVSSAEQPAQQAVKNAQAQIISRKISLKVMTLDNEKQKINDQLGNPVIIGIVVLWRVVNTAKAVFNVDNFKEFLSIQCDSALRNIVRLYPYDSAGLESEKSLRGSSQEIADKLRDEIQEKTQIAGLEILEARITHLSYAPEIAAAMLQRQQASAIIDARQMIVEGAVGMVEMALEKLSENNVVTLDEERKAAMVSNLLVVLCGNRDAQPVVNSGSIY